MQAINGLEINERMVSLGTRTLPVSRATTNRERPEETGEEKVSMCAGGDEVIATADKPYNDMGLGLLQGPRGHAPSCPEPFEHYVPVSLW